MGKSNSKYTDQKNEKEPQEPQELQEYQKQLEDKLVHKLLLENVTDHQIQLAIRNANDDYQNAEMSDEDCKTMLNQVFFRVCADSFDGYVPQGRVIQWFYKNGADPKRGVEGVLYNTDDAKSITLMNMMITLWRKDYPYEYHLIRISQVLNTYLYHNYNNTSYRAEKERIVPMMTRLYRVYSSSDNQDRDWNMILTRACLENMDYVVQAAIRFGAKQCDTCDGMLHDSFYKRKGWINENGVSRSVSKFVVSSSEETDYKFIKIRELCFESMPCQHYVLFNNEEIFMNARQIVNIFREHNSPIPEHFKKYDTC